MPELYLIGGPNGAGKTTTALRVFPALGVTNFINADLIAQGLSPLDVAKAARPAGRVMLNEMDEHRARGADFALESTLASRGLAPFIRRCKDEGYRFTLIYVWLNSADLAVARVASRVKSGGHDIPIDTIRRRYERGRANFFELYGPTADQGIVWNNSEESPKMTKNFLTRSLSIPLEMMKTGSGQSQMDIIETAFREAVADAIETHRRMGRSIVVSENGAIRRIKPSEITPRTLPHDADEAAE